MTANGYSGMPPNFAIAAPLVTKGSVHITAAGTPFFSNLIPSCTLHDEHDPQSPEAVIMTSQLSESSSSKSGGQGREAFPLLPAIDRSMSKVSDSVSQTY